MKAQSTSVPGGSPPSAVCFTPSRHPTSAVPGVYDDGLDWAALTGCAAHDDAVFELQRYHATWTLGAKMSEHSPAVAVSVLPTAAVPLIDGAWQFAAWASGAAGASSASTLASTAAASSRSGDILSVPAYAPVPAGYAGTRGAAMGNRRGEH